MQPKQLTGGWHEQVTLARIRRAPHRLSLAIFVTGLVVTGALTVVSRLNYLHNEQRLTNLQTNLTASALHVAPVDLERRLGQAVGIAAQSSDPVGIFRRNIASSMAPSGTFATATLVAVHNGQIRVLARVGAKPVDNPTGKVATALFESAARSSSLVTTRVIGRGLQRFGYFMSSKGPAGVLVAAAGQTLPANRKITIPASSPDAGLNVAIYFGRTTDLAALVETNAPHLPLVGTVSKATVPFGSSYLTLVVSSQQPLAGLWSEFVPWGILVVGVLFTLGIAAMTERLVRGRKNAERLADENQILYGEQRNISITLQRSLLPKTLPSISGVALAARFIPGEAGVEVGGDWYSVIQVDDDRFAFVVGDVSGRGLEAATIMAGLRYTIRAYASLGYNPAEILEMAAKELHIGLDKHFATVLVGSVDNRRRELTIASAGHLNALLVCNGKSEFAEVVTGVPLGVGAEPYESKTFEIAPHSTLIAYTDGLIERRDETLEVGMERLRKAAVAERETVDGLLTSIVDNVFGENLSDDDTAILGIRWLD
jgi:serine phosphatase RsbU (regulator of sigma subunit)